jgi:hypothetical protein
MAYSEAMVAMVKEEEKVQQCCGHYCPNRGFKNSVINLTKNEPFYM